MERSYDESSIYLQWLFLMGGWEESWWWLSRVGGDPYALTVCPVLVSRKCGGCGWRTFPFASSGHRPAL